MCVCLIEQILHTFIANSIVLTHISILVGRRTGAASNGPSDQGENGGSGKNSPEVCPLLAAYQEQVGWLHLVRWVLFPRFVPRCLRAHSIIKHSFNMGSGGVIAVSFFRIHYNEFNEQWKRQTNKNYAFIHNLNNLEQGFEYLPNLNINTSVHHKRGRGGCDAWVF